MKALGIIAVLIAVLALVLVGIQLPELRRYLKMESM
jgi:hypothetical protein